MEIVWHGEKVKKLVADTLLKRLKAIAVLGEREIKQSLSIGGGVSKGGGGVGRQANRSKAGQPPHNDTGRLMGSITHEVDRNRARPTARVGTNVKYGRYLELGAAAHTINPGKKGFLAWKDAATGGWVYTRKPVHIPKLEKRPFLRPWIDGARASIDAILRRPWF